MKESSDLKEETIRKETELSKTNPNVKSSLEALYLEEDRESSFQRFCASQEFKILFNEISRHVGYDWNAKICEIGAGPGFLAVALAKAGFKNVNILEPNNAWITGTGFISNAARKYCVHVWNSLDDWYESDELYDLIITKACVHHFDNISKVAAEIRCKICSDGKWLMFDEYFANSAEDLYSALMDHLHVVKYGQYEWPYSASLYVELLKLVGYKLVEVLPHRYENNYINRNISSKVRLTKTVTVISKILIKFDMTVFAFKIENYICNCINANKRFRLFTFPQLLVFRLNKIEFPLVKLD
jgi:hypothetical protein